MATNQAQIEITATDKTRAAFESVNQSLGKIKTTASAVNSVLGSIGIGLGVSAFANFAKSAFEYADSIQDVAAANDVAIATVLELNQALITSGGGAETAGTMLTKFAQYVEKAVGGSEDARQQLNKLGVSLKDLQTLSQEDLFTKTLDGMSKLSSATEKTAIKLEVFGKSTKNVDINSLNEDLKNSKGLQDANAEAIKRAADATDRWAASWNNAKISFITSIDEIYQSFKKERESDVLSNPQRYTNDEVNRVKSQIELLRQKKTATFLAAEATKELNKLGKGENVRDLAATSTETKAGNDITNYIDKLKKQVATFGDAKSAALAFDASQLKLSKTQQEQVEILLDKIKAQEDLAESQKKLSAAYGDLTAIFTLNSIEKSNVEVLQAKLDLMQELPAATREAAQAEIELAKAASLYNSMQEAQNIGINNEIERMNELYDAEKEASDEREKLFADTAEQLKRENEDLNVGLITSDKARAKAQIDLEHQRSLDRINAMMLEGEEAQQLIDQETKNYELRQKQIEKTNNIAKDLGLTFSSAFEEAVVGGKKFSAILQSLTQDIAKLILRKKVTEPLFNLVSDSISGDGLSSFFGGLFNAKGNAFNQAGVVPFANGGVFTSPQMFGYGAGNVGVLGEAGAEAILPLRRNSSGKLGVTMEGGGAGVVNNVSIVVNSDGTGRQEAGNENDLGRRIETAVRGVLMQEKRSGGMLA